MKLKDVRMEDSLSFKDYRFIENVVKSAPNIRIGMNQLLAYCEKKWSDPVWARIRSLEFEGEIPKLRIWLENVLVSEPPPENINAFWFGLFILVLENEKKRYDLQISGSTRFDPDDEMGDWTRRAGISYLPAKRSANSKILHEIYHLVAGNHSAAFFAEYILMFGYACLAVKEICNSIHSELLLGDRKRRDIAVGFDLGDFIILEGIERQKESQP